MTDADAWLDLWTEFGFADPDAAGGRGATGPQLKLATQLADERLDIDTGVREGHLREETTTDRYGTEITRCYRLNLAGGASA